MQFKRLSLKDKLLLTYVNELTILYYTVSFAAIILFLQTTLE